MDVGGWLRSLGLDQYEANFRDNKISAALLTRLTNDDLKDIGVSALGDRLQLLDAIAAFEGTKLPAALPVPQSNSAHIRAAVSLHRSRASRSSPRPGPSFMAPSPLRLAPT
jgi:hypothetical protein